MPVADAPFLARCACGRVSVEAAGPPVAHISCYCDDCQTAADLIDALPGGRSGREADGGTPNVLFRRDHVRCVAGRELLFACHARNRTATDRMVASCCNTAMFQIHRDWFPVCGVKTQCFEQAPVPLEMRIYARSAPDRVGLPGDVIVSDGAPLVLVLRIMRAYVALRLATATRKQWNGRHQR